MDLPNGARALAVFIDFENIGLSFNGRRDRFSIDKVLARRIKEQGGPETQFLPAH